MADFDSNDDDDLIDLFSSRNFEEIHKIMQKATSTFQKRGENIRYMAKHLLKQSLPERLPAVKRLREKAKYKMIVALIISELMHKIPEHYSATLSKKPNEDKPLIKRLGKVIKEAVEYFNIDIESQLLEAAEVVSKNEINMEIEFLTAASEGNAALVCFILFYFPEFASKLNAKNETVLFNSHPMFWKILITEFKVPALELNSENKWFVVHHVGKPITWTHEENYFIPLTDTFHSRGKLLDSSSLQTILLNLGMVINVGTCFKFALEYQVEGSKSEPQYFILTQRKPTVQKHKSQGYLSREQTLDQDDLFWTQNIAENELPTRQNVIQDSLSQLHQMHQTITRDASLDQNVLKDDLEQSVIQEDLSIGLLLATTIYNKQNQMLPTAVRTLLDFQPSSNHHPSMVIPFVSHQSVGAVLKRVLNVNTQDSDGMSAIHYAVIAKDIETLKSLLKSGGTMVDVKEDLGNTPLHICDIRNHAIIHSLLNAGADFYNIKDQEGVPFMLSSHEAMEVIRTFLRDKDSENAIRLLARKEHEIGLKCIADCLDDNILSTIIKKITDFYNSNSGDITKDWILNGNGKKLLIQIWESRIVKKSVLKDSYNLMLRLFSSVLDNDKKDIIEYCHDSLDVNMRMSIMQSLKSVLPKEINPTLLAKASIKSGFILLLLLNIVDFVSDIVLTYDYYEWTNSSIVKQYPLNAKQCVGRTNLRMVCNIHNINENIPFWYSVVVLTMPFIAQILLILQSSAKQFLAEMSGLCCKNDPQKSKLRVFAGYLFSILLQPIATQCYSFLWRKRIELQVSNKSKVKVDQRISESHDNCQMELLDANHNTARLLHGTTKLITACTENYFMPLLQLYTLFPLLSITFRRSPNNMFNDPLDFITKISQNWQYYLTVFSIITSILSLSSTWTFVYFTKPTKVEEKNIQNILIYYIAVLFQCISRLLAFEIAFSVFSLMTGYSFLIMLLSVVMCHSLVMFVSVLSISLVERRHRARQPVKSKASIIWDSACTALTSLYIFNEIECEKTAFAGSFVCAGKAKYLQDFEMEPLNEEKYVFKEQSNRSLVFTLWLHGIFVVENLAMAALGWLIKDADYDALSFFIAVSVCEIFGLLFKTVYYLFLHPWKKLKSHREWKKKAFWCVLIVIYMTSLCIVANQVPQSGPVVVAVGVTSFVIAIFLLFTLFVTNERKKKSI